MGLVPLRRFVVLAALLWPEAAAAAPPDPQEFCVSGCAQVQFRVRMVGERTLLSQARVLVVPAPLGAKPGDLDEPPPPPDHEPLWTRSGVTADDGTVTLTEVPQGRVHVVVLAPGFGRLDRIVEIDEDRMGPLDVFVRPDAEIAYRTVVETPAPPRSEATSRVLSREEIRTMPGTQGDALRGLQNLPGVARAPGSLGLLVLRGAPPEQSKVFLGGHPIPRAFHLLSLSSVFPGEVLDEMRFVPGNFDAAYGNVTGGVVVIEPRQGRRDGYHGHAEVDLTGAGALLEGPAGKGSFVVAGQRGYVDGVLRATDAVIERTTGDRENFLLPAYYDYQGLFDHPVGQGGSVGLRLFGSGDRLRGSGSANAAQPSTFEFRGDFHRLDFVYRKRRPGWRFRFTPSVRFELNRFNSSTDVRRRTRRDLVVSNRMELRKQLSRRLAFTLGTDFEVAQYWGIDDTQVSFDAENAIREVDRQQGHESASGVYGTAHVRLGMVTLEPAIRASAFTVKDQAAFSFDPRFVGSIEPNDQWRVHVGLGRYSQVRSIRESESIDLVGQGTGVGDGTLFLPPVFSRFDPQVTFTIADRDLTVRQAIHASTGARYRFGNGWSAEATGFLREQNNATPVFIQSSVVPFDTKDRTLGLELLLRKRLIRRLYGWVTYTLMWSQILYEDTPPGFTPRRRPSDFDQRHNLILLASYVLPRDWRIGARFRLVSGYPYTPVIGSIALQGGQYGAILGNRNTARLAPFHQLDLRVDKRWVARRAIITGYLDIQNVYNAQNAEAVVYSADYREQVGVVGVPIFPSLGIRVDY